MTIDEAIAVFQAMVDQFAAVVSTNPTLLFLQPKYQAHVTLPLLAAARDLATEIKARLDSIEIRLDVLELLP